MATLNKKVDKVRAEETRQLKADGYEPILKHSRWCLLKRPENRTAKQTVKLRELMKYNLRTMRAYLMKEDFQRFWSYRSGAWAGRFLDDWCTRAMRSQLQPLKEMAGTLRRHRELLLNWFAAKGELSSGSVQGMNTKANVALRKSYGFRTDNVYDTVLSHDLARLPEHDRAHQFC
jgi:transposase